MSNHPQIRALNGAHEECLIDCYARFSRMVDGVEFNFAVAQCIYDSQLCVLHVESGKRVGVVKIWRSRGKLPPEAVLVDAGNDVIDQKVAQHGADRVRVVIQSAEVLK